VAMTALRMLDVPKDLPDSMLSSSAVATADADDLSGALNAHSTDAARSRAVSSVTQPPVQAGFSASAEEPVTSRASNTREAGRPDPSLDRRPFFSAALVGPKVPDFRGMTLRGVLEESAATGVQIEVSGNGLARNQNPPAGSILAPGARVRVQFTR